MPKEIGPIDLLVVTCVARLEQLCGPYLACLGKPGIIHSSRIWWVARKFMEVMHIHTQQIFPECDEHSRAFFITRDDEGCWTFKQFCYGGKKLPCNEIVFVHINMHYSTFPLSAPHSNKKTGLRAAELNLNTRDEKKIPNKSTMAQMKKDCARIFLNKWKFNMHS